MFIIKGGGHVFSLGGIETHNTVCGKILVGGNIGKQANPNQLEGKVLVNELYV